MTYSDTEVNSHLQLGEDGYWEFKQVVFKGNRPIEPRRDSWADEITAFANANGGVLLCGVTDSGDVEGMSREQMDALETLIVEVCSDSIHPPVRAGIFRRTAPNGKPFLSVEVPEGYALHESSGSAFIRGDSAKKKMSGEERLHLAQRRGQSSFLWFDKQPVEGTGFGTLEEALWKPLLSPEQLSAPELALEKMGFLASDQNRTVRATVAGILLCSSSPESWLPNAYMTATRYMGGDRASGQLDSQEIRGPLNKQVKEALAFAVRNMSVAARKDPARQDVPQYSVKALFEALVNAVVHRDYSIRGSRIRLSMFEDRMEIRSPGGLPNNLTVESMGERQSTRNEVLTSALGRINVGGLEGAEGRQFFVERRGDGVPIIQRETRELCGSLPSFRLVDETELCLTIPSAVLEFAPANTVVSVRSCAGKPLAGATVLALYPNKTWKLAVTDANGEARVDLYTTHLPMVVFAGLQGFAAGLEKDWIPAQRPLALELSPLSGGGSVIFQEATGHIPGISGRLNPIRDTLDRTCLYASNISINQGKQQPVYFAFNEDLRLTDADGKEAMVRILDVVGRSVLLEYRLLAVTSGSAD